MFFLCSVTNLVWKLPSGRAFIKHSGACGTLEFCTGFRFDPHSFKVYSLHELADVMIVKIILTLKAPRKIIEQTTIYFYFLFFRENNAWHYMWIVCLADDSHVMSSIISSKKLCRTCFENVVYQSWLALYGLMVCDYAGLKQIAIHHSLFIKTVIGVQAATMLDPNKNA